LSPATIVRVSAPRSTRSFRRFFGALDTPPPPRSRPIPDVQFLEVVEADAVVAEGFDVGHVGFVSGVVVRFVAAVVRLAVVAALLVRFVAVLRLGGARLQLLVERLDALVFDLLEQLRRLREVAGGALAGRLDGGLVDRAVLAELVPETLGLLGCDGLEQDRDRLRDRDAVVDDLRGLLGARRRRASTARCAGCTRCRIARGR
jgi:hypothetical protein